MTNPFRFVGPVAPDALIDRREELDQLARAVASGVSVRLAGPRRFGKTSVIDAHLARMAATGHRVARVDLSRVSTVTDVCVRLVRAYQPFGGPARGALARIARRLGVTIGAAGIAVTLSPARTEPPGEEQARFLLAEILDLPATLADGGRTVVALDEFQDVMTADRDLDGLLRSVIQHHGDQVSYLFAGSAPTMMRALFEDRERPFYGQARPIAIGRLPADETARDVEATLRRHGLDGGEAVADVVALGAGHPQRTMLLAHHLFELLDGGATADESLAARALDLALHDTADAHATVWDQLDQPERAVLVALADGLPPTGHAVADRSRLPRSTLADALRRLTRDGRQVEAGDSTIIDPLLEIWLRRRNEVSP
ncbi:AAA family ATPase [Patulibacter defluvii]|uniref:AAA family ATPase n=1 Tax=Patulibacter defluvii TaxID=3095358 RepID=UPI002A749CA4|nr:hypothetical protein [Patulibacter sp. DM4]